MVNTFPNRKQFPVKVIAYDAGSGVAKLVDETEQDDVVPYEIFVPACFGGSSAPYPKVGETIVIVYDKIRQRVREAWHPVPIPS